MKIGVVSDTHISKWSQGLPAPLLKGLDGVDRIVHAGDLVTSEVVDMLAEIAPVDAVAGNNDPWPLFQTLGRRRILSYSDIEIGLIHGDCEHRGTLDCAIAAFRDDPVRCIIFGHSHNPYCREHDGVLLFNPGSPTRKRTNKRFSYGLLHITGGTIMPELCFFDADTKS